MFSEIPHSSKTEPSALLAVNLAKDECQPLTATTDLSNRV